MLAAPRARSRLYDLLNGATRARVLAVFPLLTIGAYWSGDQSVLILASIAFPLILALQAIMVPDRVADRPRSLDAVTGLPLSRDLVEFLDDVLIAPDAAGERTACLTLDLDGFGQLNDRLGHAAGDEILARVAERLQTVLRDRDLAVRLESDCFAIGLAPQRHLDLETVLAIARRAQKAVAEALMINGAPLYVTCSVGYCLSSRAPEPTGTALLTAASTALAEASRAGPSAVRGFSDEMMKRTITQHALEEEVAQALENGEIITHFQPQICLETGQVVGFETLARWLHPDRGMISPGVFLPAVEAGGLSVRLGEIILCQALSALRRWQDAGHHVPSIGVNFSREELGDPTLVERISWELDRFDLSHNRLGVEILENVIASPNEDVTFQNIRHLARLGCRIDLDDFGTGNASITTLRRFPIDRIKIDRSFVTQIDQDRDQSDMVGAILTLADQLNLETLAEGVETPGERAHLTAAGCAFGQGFGIARPMPFEEAQAWLSNQTVQDPQAGGAPTPVAQNGALLTHPPESA